MIEEDGEHGQRSQKVEAVRQHADVPGTADRGRLGRKSKFRRSSALVVADETADANHIQAISPAKRNCG